MKSYGTKSSSETLVPYKQKRKAVVPASERERGRKSLKSYNVGKGGNDIA